MLSPLKKNREYPKGGDSQAVCRVTQTSIPNQSASQPNTICMGTIVGRSINRIFESGEPAAYEITGAGPDGTTSWYSVRLGPIKHDGHIIAVTLMALDITERKRMEQAMQESREKLRVVFDSIGDGITVVDLAGNIIDVNETVLRIKGYSREDVIGRYGLDFVAEKDRARAIDSMMDFLKGEEEHTPTMEYMLLKKDGSEISCEASASLLRDGGDPA